MRTGWTRDGHALVKFVTWFAVVATTVVVAFVARANYRREGKFSLRLFDGAWWSVGSSDAKPILDRSASAADKAYQEVWGADGWSGKAQAWLDRQRAKPAAVPESKEARRARLEQSLAEARALFQEGFSHYQEAKPEAEISAQERRDHLDSAHEKFLLVKTRLETDLPAYEALPEHDQEIAADAKELAKLNRQLDGNVEKLRAQ